MRVPISSLNLVRSFEAAARHGTFTRAAAELGVHQPAISRQVAELEKQIGRPLFLRGTEGLKLTPGGQVLFEVAQETLGRLGTTLTRLQADAAGRLTLNCSIGLADAWLLPRLPVFHAAHPEMQIDVVTRDSPADARIALADARILFGTAGRGDHVLFPERLVVVAAPGQHDTVARPLLALSMPEYAGDWGRVLSHLDHPMGSGPMRYFSSYTAYMHALRAGEGIGLAWDVLVVEALQSGRLVPVSKACVKTDRVCFLQSDLAESSILNALLPWMQKEARATQDAARTLIGT